MGITVRNISGESVQLASAPLAQGGEATVYDVPCYPTVVVKYYHDHVLQKRDKSLHAKIEFMSSVQQLGQIRQHSRLAWPRFSVFDQEGRWRGYAMRKAGGVRMNVLAHAKAYCEHFPNLDRADLVSYLLNLLNTLRDLHKAGVMIGDYNLANFLCNPDSDTVTLIDCDSWQIEATGKIFYCPVAAPDMLPPELQGKELGRINRTMEGELFSLAILIFKMLMLGRHPYDVVGGASPVENIRKGYFPYGLGGGGIPKGPWFNIWSHLPFKLKEQFIRTFKAGTQDASERTTLTEWIDILKVYQRELGSGWHNT
jgi:DNA-binding helix-hairpin-helix protein with protein kinase domain